MSTKDLIDDLLSEIQTSVQADIATAGIDDFDTYLADTPNNAEEKQLCIYFDSKQSDGTNDIFNFIVQAQLFKVGTRDSWKYQDIVESAIKKVNPELINYEMRDRISVESYPIFENDSTIVLFEISFSRVIDDCNFND